MMACLSRVIQSLMRQRILVVFGCWTLFIGLGLLLTVFPANAESRATPLVLDDQSNIDGQWIVNQAEILSDPDSRMGFEDVRGRDDWQLLDAAATSRGLSGEHIWLRMTVDNRSAEMQRLYLAFVDQFFENFHLFYLDQMGRPISEQNLTARQAPSEWVIRTMPLAGFVDIPAKNQRQIYMLISHDHVLPINALVRVWTADHFYNFVVKRLQQDTAMMLAPIVAGVVMIIFGLYMKRARLFYFSGLMFSSAWTFGFLSGHARSLPDMALPHMLEPGFHLSMIVVLFFMFEFSRRHMGLKVDFPQLNTVYSALRVIPLFGVLLCLTGISKFAEVILTFVVVGMTFFVLMPVSIYVAWKKRLAHLRWHAIAMVGFVVMATMGQLARIAIVSDDGAMFEFFTRMTFLAQLLEVVFFVMSLAAWMRGQEQLRVQAEITSLRDPLTGLWNRRGFDRLVQDRLKQSNPGSLWIAAVDVDHFKSINDTWTHDGGDAVLRNLAKVMQNTCRDQDLIARFGGEEFVLVLQAKDKTMASAICERLRQAVEQAPTRYQDASIFHTISIGLAQLQDHQESGLRPVMLSADTALYDAKNAGRNRVCMAA